VRYEDFVARGRRRSPPGKIVAIERLQHRARGDSRGGARIHRTNQGRVVVYLPKGVTASARVSRNEQRHADQPKAVRSILEGRKDGCAINGPLGAGVVVTSGGVSRMGFGGQHWSPAKASQQASVENSRRTMHTGVVQSTQGELRAPTLFRPADDTSDRKKWRTWAVLVSNSPNCSAPDSPKRCIFYRFCEAPRRCCLSPRPGVSIAGEPKLFALGMKGCSARVPGEKVVLERSGR
jgi:hypothetical protein